MNLDPIALADASPDADAFEWAVHDALARIIGFDVAFFATLGNRPAAVGVDVQALEEALASRRYSSELIPIKAAALSTRGVAVDTDVLGERGVRRCAYHRDFVAPLGGRHSMIAYLVLRGRPLGVVVLGRAGAGFSAAEVARVETLLPAIAFGRASFYAPVALGSLPQPRTSVAQRVLHRVSGGATRAHARAAAGDVLVRDRHGYREMVAVRGDAELVWSRAELGEPRRSGWFYVELFHLAAARANQRGRVLFIGCGGAVAVRQFAETYPGVRIDLVDVDPTVIALARDWYGLAAIPSLRVHIADGFDFVATATDRTWDAVIVDAYDAGDVPARLVAPAFFQGVGRVLRRGGAMAFNAIGPLTGPGSVRVVERAVRTALKDVRLVPVLDPEERFSPRAVRNVIVLASAS